MYIPQLPLPSPFPVGRNAAWRTCSRSLDTFTKIGSWATCGKHPQFISVVSSTQIPCRLVVVDSKAESSLSSLQTGKYGVFPRVPLHFTCFIFIFTDPSRVSKTSKDFSFIVLVIRLI